MSVIIFIRCLSVLNHYAKSHLLQQLLAYKQPILISIFNKQHIINTLPKHVQDLLLGYSSINNDKNMTKRHKFLLCFYLHSAIFTLNIQANIATSPLALRSPFASSPL